MNEDTQIQQYEAKKLELEEKREEWKRLQQQANMVIESGLAPDSLRNKEAVLTVMMSGREMDIPPMLALREIHIIKGKPRMGAKLMAALVRQHNAGWFEHDHQFDFQKREGYCTITGHRVDTPGEHDETYTTTWDMERAKPVMADGRGGIKTNWQNYPDQMLWNRAMSEVCRRLFSDIIGGLYTPDELGGHTGPSTSAPAQQPQQAQNTQPTQVRRPQLEGVSANAEREEPEPQPAKSAEPEPEQDSNGQKDNAKARGEKQLKKAIRQRDDFDRGMSGAVLQLWRNHMLRKPSIAAVKDRLEQAPVEQITDIKGISGKTYNRLCDALLDDGADTEGTPEGQAGSKPDEQQEASEGGQRYEAEQGDWHEHKTLANFRCVAYVTDTNSGDRNPLYRHEENTRKFACPSHGQQTSDYCEHLRAARDVIKATTDKHRGE